METHTLFRVADDYKAPKEILKEKILISDEAIEFLTNLDLFNIVMSNDYQQEQFGKALAHVCFENIKLSKKICKRLMKQISFSDYDRV